MHLTIFVLVTIKMTFLNTVVSSVFSTVFFFFFAELILF